MPVEELALPSSETVARLAVSSTGFIFDPVTGRSFSVNEGGLAILRALQNGARTLPDVVHLLSAAFDAPLTVLERDVIEFSSRLKEAFR